MRAPKREGWLMVDHRASPGFTAANVENFRQLGLDVPHVGEGQMRELGTQSCAHCGTVVVKNPDRIRARGHCVKCDKYICDPCVAIGDCRPIQALADRLLGSDKPIDPLSPLVLRRT